MYPMTRCYKPLQHAAGFKWNGIACTACGAVPQQI